MAASPGSWSEWVLFPAMLKRHQKAPKGGKRLALLSRWLCFGVGGGGRLDKRPFLPMRGPLLPSSYKLRWPRDSLVHGVFFVHLTSSS